MNWYKLISYDIRFGLVRKRNILSVFQFILIGLSYWRRSQRVLLGKLGCDYLIYIFSGIKPITNAEEFVMPIIWLQIMCCPLYLNLNYPRNDLTSFGLQSLIRTHKRTQWYICKCIWSAISSVVYFTIAGIVAFALPLLLQKDSTLSFMRYSVVDSGIQAIYQIGIAEMTEIYFAPLLNIIAINMLQMTLSFFVKEVYAFICCLSFLILSVYMPSALILGNGAMIIRSELYGVGVSAISSCATVIVSLIMVVLSVIIGIVRFKRFDILSVDY